MNVLGTRFGDDMQLLRQIGKGALARVFLASNGRIVKAVKLFPARYRQRAEREHAIGGALDHPHLNPVEQLLVVADHPAVVMPYVPGQRLGRWLLEREGRHGFLTVFAGLLEALSYLHQRGIVHRDVKPENILVGRDLHAWLLDFDLAVRQGDDPQAPALAGTMAYLSPEQARGERATAASDLYAAGVILYWGLSGELPYSGSAREVVAAHGSPPPPLTDFGEDLAPFAELTARLLAFDPAARFGSADEVIAALEPLRQPPG